MSRKALVVSSVFAGLAFSTHVCAAEDKYDWQSCYAGQIHRIQHADGLMSGSYALVGMMSGTEGSPVHMMSGRCLGAFSILSGQLDENGSCEFVNAAADKFFGVYARKGDPAKAEGTWHVVHGTGKFADMSMEGKWMPIGAFPPTGEPNMTTSCNHEWGTYTVK